ncbi:MAG: ribbon-helix-helix protein, CopG family [bacterium]|nr:ribbon-helix-helix protein, CopG family [bacterium]
MARREVLVQLDDDLVTELDRIAAARSTSRSELLRQGARAVIEADEEAAADAELIAAYRRQPPEPALTRSAAHLAARTAPEW